MKFLTAVTLLCGVLVFFRTPRKTFAGSIGILQHPVNRNSQAFAVYRPDTHKVCDGCFAHNCYQRTCTGDRYEACIKKCNPRYVCEEGYVRQYTIGPCILQSNCPPIH